MIHLTAMNGALAIAKMLWLTRYLTVMPPVLKLVS